MDESKPLKVRLTFSVILVGVSLLFAAVVTDHWAVLIPKVEKYNATCEAAHFGLWRLCTKRIFMQEQGPKEKGCGRISLPGANSPGLLRPASRCHAGVYELEEGGAGKEKVDEDTPASFFGAQAHHRSGDPPVADGVMPLRSGLAVARGEHNCSYFKHFTPGQSSEIFEVTTQKEYSISAAAIAIFSVGFAIIGTICVLLSFRKKRDYLLKPASMFYTFAGLCIIISVEVMRQSVKRMIDSKETVWMEYSYSWSFACACSSFVLLFICGIILLLIALPRFPQNPWETCMDAEPEH
ncbi:hypothetical protein QYF61_008626 [Mycteria americana]|uniref:Dihydropyridine-sensitive L-type, skeletal muscle calcium channel subunit gamma n=37 Tax=Neoaves TaxID=3078114 RepID=A0AAN7RQD3_MYCAM|nr:hypothetical protein QYF61_008626 [Mycteria americana]